MAPPSMLEYALRYRRRGFSVIPCKKDKKPYLKSWQAYQMVKPTEDEIRSWWGEHPDANIAIICGAVSGVDVLDCDSQEAYDNLNEFYLNESFQTPIVKTPKGRHIYFRHQPGLSNAVRAIKGTDIRTHGGYVIAPPSRNGHDTAYYWYEGLTPKDCTFAEWPQELFVALQAIAHAQARPKVENTSLAPDVGSGALFSEGRRDNDLFHVANVLTKGGCEEIYKRTVLETLAKNCTPPFPQDELESKIKSAMQRRAVKDRNLTGEVKEWVLSTNGEFSTADCRRDLNITGREDCKNMSKAFENLTKEGLIERFGKKNGIFRMVEDQCKVMDWIDVNCDYKDLWLPLGLGEICGIQPGNILVFAGAKDSGKTAFLMNCAKENRYNYKIHYFNSEMGPTEFKMRAFLFNEPLSTWKDVSVYERSENFHDVIKPGEGNLNIIDFLEVVDEFWKVAANIQKIHQKLNGALCIIGLQKNPHVDLGRGGAFSIEKARLYISMDYGKAKIVSCKNFKQNEIIEGNPRGYVCSYKIHHGCQINRDHGGWTNPTDLTVKS